MKFLALVVVAVLLSACTAGPAQEPEQIQQVPAISSESPLPECNRDAEDGIYYACLIRNAVIGKNERGCSAIDQSNARDLCYMQYAAWHNEPAVCSKISSSDKKDGCYSGMAKQTSDIALCDYISVNANPLNSADICKKAAALNNTKPNIRNESMLADDKVNIVVFTTDSAIDSLLVNEYNKLSTERDSDKTSPPTSIKTLAEAGTWMAYYYTHRNPDLTPDAMKAIAFSGEFDPVDSHGVPYFYGQLFKEHEAKVPKWINELDDLKTGDERVLLWLSLWAANTEESRAILQDEQSKAAPGRDKEFITILLEQPTTVVDNEVQTTYALDAQLAVFYATGDEEPILKMIDTLPWIVEHKKDYDQRVDEYNRGIKDASEEETLKATKYLTAMAAKRMLTSLAANHKRVHEIVEEETSHRTGTTRDELQDILSTAGNGN